MAHVLLNRKNAMMQTTRCRAAKIPCTECPAQIHAVRVTEGIQCFHIPSLSGLHLRFSGHIGHQTIQCQLARSMAGLEKQRSGRLTHKASRKSRLTITQIYSRKVKIMQMSFEKCRKLPDSGHYGAIMPSTFHRYTLPVPREKLRKLFAEPWIKGGRGGLLVHHRANPEAYSQHFVICGADF